jgi:hypothetical protein
MSTNQGRESDRSKRTQLPSRPLDTWLRTALVGLVLGISAIFGIAAWLNPYGSDGSALQMGTHEQLGFPPCNFMILTGKPCPSCGMTTSFALMVRGDLENALAANPVGSALAFFLMLLLPWGLASLWFGKTLFIRSIELTGLVVLALFVGIALLRWGIIIAPAYWK